MQKAIFPTKDMRITQGYGPGTYSHDDSCSLDISGVNGVLLRAFAPFDCVIKKIYTQDANEVWIESLEPVLYADGTVDYMTMMFIHDNDVSDLYVGKVLKQYEEFYQEGVKGNVTGSHIHFECGKGRFDGSGWHQNNTGAWSINNGVTPESCLFVTANTNIVDGCGYNWKYDTSVDKKFKIGDQVYLNGYLYVDSGGNGQGGYFKNELVTITNISYNPISTKPYLLNNGDLGWVAEEDLSTEPILDVVPEPQPEPEIEQPVKDPTEDLKNEIQTLKDLIALKDKQINELKSQLQDQSTLRSFEAKMSGNHYIYLNKDETLCYKIN